MVLASAKIRMAAGQAESTGPTGPSGPETFVEQDVSGGTLTLDYDESNYYTVVNATDNYNVVTANISTDNNLVQRMAYQQIVDTGNLGKGDFSGIDIRWVDGVTPFFPGYLGGQYEVNLTTVDKGATHTGEFKTYGLPSITGTMTEEVEHAAASNYRQSHCFITDDGSVAVTSPYSSTIIYYWDGSAFVGISGGTGTNSVTHYMDGSDDGSLLYTANTSGNVYRSVNGGQSWSLISTTGFTTYGVVCSADGQTLLSSSSSGNYKMSYDGGATWSATRNIGISRNMYGSHFSMTPDGQKIFWCDMSTTSNVYTRVSTDAGVTFTQMTTAPAMYGCRMFADGQSFAGFSGTQTMVSKDNGVTWETNTTGLPLSLTSSGIIATGRNALTTIFIGSTTEKLYISTDGGWSYKEINDVTSESTGTVQWAQTQPGFSISPNGSKVMCTSHTSTTGTTMRAKRYGV